MKRIKINARAVWGRDYYSKRIDNIICDIAAEHNMKYK